MLLVREHRFRVFYEVFRYRFLELLWDDYGVAEKDESELYQK